MTWRPKCSRSALLIALSIALSSSAVACEPKPLSDTDESFAFAAAKRMTRLGVTDVEPAAPLKDGGELYVLLGSKVRLAIRDDGGYPTEVGTVLSEPSNSDDRNRQVTLISFMLARIAGGAETNYEDVRDFIRSAPRQRNVDGTRRRRRRGIYAIRGRPRGEDRALPITATMRSKPGPPMTLANMRKNGVRAVTATCESVVTPGGLAVLLVCR
jgi:hypothetical protein